MTDKDSNDIKMDEDPFPGLEEELDALMQESNAFSEEPFDSEDSIIPAEEIEPEVVDNPDDELEPAASDDPAETMESAPTGNPDEKTESATDDSRATKMEPAITDTPTAETETASDEPASVKLPAQEENADPFADSMDAPLMTNIAPAESAKSPSNHSPSGLTLILALLLATAAALSTLWVLEDPSGTPLGIFNQKDSRVQVSVAKKAIVANRPSDAKTPTTKAEPEKTSPPVPAEQPEPAMKPEPVVDKVTPASAPATRPSASGPWIVNLVSLANREIARTYVEQLTIAGVKAEIVPVRVDNKTWYRARVPGFSSKDAALQEKTRLENKLNLTGAWISKEKP